MLSEKLREGRPIGEAELDEVQRRRKPAVRTIQRVQGAIQGRIVGATLRHQREMKPPLPLRLLLRIPGLRDLPARMLAFGPRPYRLERADEHPPA